MPLSWVLGMSNYEGFVTLSWVCHTFVGVSHVRGYVTLSFVGMSHFKRYVTLLWVYKTSKGM